MMADRVQTHPEFRAFTPRRLFDGPYEDHYDVSRDDRFLMVRQEPLPPVTQIELVQNWPELLRQLDASR